MKIMFILLVAVVRMSHSSDLSGKRIKAPDVNPFDKSYHSWQHDFDTEIISLLSNIFNFTIEKITSPLVTDLQGYEKNPNSWLVEQIVNGTCEISSTTMVLTPESPDTVRYSLGVGTFRPQLYYKARSVREESNIYFIPFSVDVWICLSCLLLVITIALTFILGRETRLPHDTPYDIVARIAEQKHQDGIEWKPQDLEMGTEESVRLRERWEVGEILLVTVGALCQQGSARDPSTGAARTLLLVLFVLAVLSYTAYSASVISLISLLPSTEQEQHVSHRSLPKATRILLQDTNFYRYSFELPGRDVEFVNLERGFDETSEGKAVFVGDRDVCLTYLHRRGYGPEKRCTLSRVFLGLEHQRVFVFRKGSVYQEPINHNILRLRQYGLLARERKKIFDLRYPCSFKEKSALSGFVSIDLKDTEPALLLLAWGVLVSLAILFLEYVIYFSAKGLEKIFGRSWRKVDAKVEAILVKWDRQRKSRVRRNNHLDNFDSSVIKGDPFTRRNHFFSLRPIRPLPFTR